MAGDATMDDIWAASEAQQSSSTELSDIARMADDVADLENQIDAMDAAKAELEERKFKLLTVLIPEAMAAAGTAGFTTQDGRKISVGTHVSGSLGSVKDTAPEVRQARIDYVVSQGGAGIVTADVIAKFGRTNREAAIELARSLEGRDDASIVLAEDIHHSTLKAWGRERLENPVEGQVFEPEKAGLWAGRIAKIEKPKAPK